MNPVNGRSGRNEEDHKRHIIRKKQVCGSFSGSCIWASQAAWNRMANGQKAKNGKMVEKLKMAHGPK